jgi:hypothetical protein
MTPYQVAPDLVDSDAKSTKVRVYYHERDLAQRIGCSAEITVYVDRTGLELRQLSDVAIREAERYLRRILDAED